MRKRLTISLVCILCTPRYTYAIPSSNLTTHDCRTRHEVSTHSQSTRRQSSGLFTYQEDFHQLSTEGTIARCQTPTVIYKYPNTNPDSLIILRRPISLDVFFRYKLHVCTDHLATLEVCPPGTSSSCG